MRCVFSISASHFFYITIFTVLFNEFRAIYRQRYFQYMDSLHFHEFINGEIKAVCLLVNRSLQDFTDVVVRSL